MDKSKSRPGEMNGNAVLTKDMVRAIRRLWKSEKLTQSEIAYAFSVSRSAVKHVVNKTTWDN